MKKVLKSLIFTFAFAASAFAMASCGGHTHHLAKEWSKDATKHWHDCSGCDDLVDKAAHAWGEWIVDEEPTETEKGSHHRICSVCNYEATEEIPMLAPEFGVATDFTAVYAQVPAEWDTANIYYWAGNEGNTIEDAYKVGWPGTEMTLVNEEDHIWGFMVPAGVDHVIFNDGATQTVDIDFSPAKNLYVLDTVNGEGKYTIYYSVYEPTADDPELGRPEGRVIERITIYAQVPADWEEVYVHFWGSIEDPDWPGREMTLVDEEEHIYSFDIQEIVVGIIFNNGNGTQTANIEDFELDAEGLNGFVVADTLEVTYAHYADGVFTPLEA
ncbi:MAG: starch-binding protein [Erysipelotrichales bacterium]|nr:starch-binding protein [Erysipelotrichales bacterium]